MYKWHKWKQLKKTTVSIQKSSSSSETIHLPAYYFTYKHQLLHIFSIIMPLCGRCCHTTNSLALGCCSFCLKDTGFDQNHIEASLHKPLTSTSSNPRTTTSSQFPFQKKSVIPPSSQPSSVPPASTSALNDYFQNAVRNKQKKPQVATYPNNKPSRSASKSTLILDYEHLIDLTVGLFYTSTTRSTQRPAF
jgi:hypothetical protein